MQAASSASIDYDSLTKLDMELLLNLYEQNKPALEKAYTRSWQKLRNAIQFSEGMIAGKRVDCTDIFTKYGIPLKGN